MAEDSKAAVAAVEPAAASLAFVARERDLDLDTIIADITRCFAAAQTPEPLREAFTAFADANKAETARLFANVAAVLAWWLVKGREAGHAPDVLDQVAFQTTQRACAIVARSMKLRQDEPFEPARFAIVSYAIAQDVARAQGSADLDGIVAVTEDIASEIETENARLRDLLKRTKQEMWRDASRTWTMEDFKNWAIVQEIDAALADAAEASAK
jgi:hypothetical protein